MTLGCDYDNVERLCLGAVWTDEVMRLLEDELERGRGHRQVVLDVDQVETLCDGLRVLSDNLHSMSTPYPPPSVPPRRDDHLRVVK